MTPNFQSMDAANTIQDAVARVNALRSEVATRSDWQDAATAIKSLQARRFAGTYADLLSGAVYADATRFFLAELYSEKDYADRDAQFARIAGPLQKFFPQRVVDTAVMLAQLHVLTEELDHDMAMAWVQQQDIDDDALRYLQAWRTVASGDKRKTQLDTVLEVGHELERLVRLPGLRMALKMMRRPARASGLGALQSFLEAGFDTFSGLVHGPDRGSAQFLEIIASRESVWLDRLSCMPVAESSALLASCLQLGDQRKR